MSRQVPRRPASSRTPTSRPRKLAGQGSAPTDVSLIEPVETTGLEAPAEESLVEPVETTAAVAPAEESLVEPVETTAADAPAEASELEPDRLPPAAEGGASPSGLSALFDSRRATAILVSVVVVLALAAGGLLIWNHYSGDDQAKPSKQPVVISGDDATEAVASAAKSAETIVATSYKDYDKQVDEATALMTPVFAKQYRQSAEDIKPAFVAAKTEIEVRVVAQGVVHATPTEVQALLFLNQYTSKDGGDTTYTPYRVLVTVIHTNKGWVVSNLDTQ